MITGRQIRAARGLLGWDATDLAAKAGLTRETVSKIETGSVQARETTLTDITQVFDQHGLEFTDNQGVKFKSHDIEVYEGPQRFADFYDFLYEHLKRNGGDVCLSVVDEKLLSKYRKDPELHRTRMKELVDEGRVTFRIIATESNFHSSYAQYRWQPALNVVPTSFYAFGECLALISFVHSPAPYVILIKSGPFAEAYRQSFNIAWKNANEPPRIRGKS